MNKKTFMIQAVLSACCIITSCSSDTVNGDNEYFTHGQITYVQEDESKIFFFDNQDGICCYLCSESNGKSSG